MGGVSVGARDLVRGALRRAGARLRFWRVAIQPGKPFTFGLWNDTVVFGLPGNPASALVTFELFVRPALRALAGLAGDGRVGALVRLARVQDKPPDLHPLPARTPGLYRVVHPASPGRSRSGRSRAVT